MAAYIAGNGKSRRNIPLDKVKAKGKLYGCNSIYKEITPDVLVSTDEGPSHQIQLMGYAREHDFYTRNPYSNYGAKQLRSPFASWGSGPNAVQLALAAGHNELYLFGFDFGSINHQYNNMFAGHEFYQNEGSNPTYGIKWVNQIKALMVYYNKVQFNIVAGQETAHTNEFSELKNVKVMQIDEFLKHINNV